MQYLTDESGNKKAVVIPYDEWLKIEKELQELREYQAMNKNLTHAFDEVKDIKHGNISRDTLNDFLNES